MKTFTDKRSADNYDKMLDMADAVYSLLESSPISLSESDREELSVFLAEQREETLVALQAKKAPSAPKKKKASKQADLLNDDEQDISPASLSETLLTERILSLPLTLQILKIISLILLLKKTMPLD